MCLRSYHYEDRSGRGMHYQPDGEVPVAIVFDTKGSELSPAALYLSFRRGRGSASDDRYHVTLNFIARPD